MRINSSKVSDQQDIQIEELLIDNYSDPYYSVFESSKSRVIPSGNYELYNSGKPQYYDLKSKKSGGRLRSCCKKIARCFSKKKLPNQITKLEMIEMKKRTYLNEYAYEQSSTYMPKIMIQIYQKISSIVPVFQPESNGYLYWQALNGLLILFFFFEISFIMFFRDILVARKDDFNVFAITEILYLGILIFLIDMCVQFNTAVYIEGILKSDRIDIAKSYLRQNFWFDLIPLLSLTFQLFNPLNRFIYTNVIFYMKVYQLIEIQYKIQQLLQLRRRKLAIYSLVQLLVWLIFLCHVFACFFFCIGYYETIVEDNSDSWLQPYKMKSITYQYIFSFYWSVTTMISVGYGDITPKNAPEVLMTIFAMFVSCIVFAYSVNAIWEIIREYDENRYKFQKNVTAINAFMRDHNINRKLKTQIAVYLTHLWESQKRRDFESEQIMIKKLAPALREELLFDSFGLFLQKTPFFSDNFSIEFLKELAEDIEQVRFSEGEVIFNQHDESDDFSVYFVLSGQVELYLDTPKPIFLAYLREYQSFGLKGFVKGFERTCSAKCITYSTIYKISRTKFLARLESFVSRREKETYHKIRNQVIFKKNYSRLYLKCFICESENHLAYNCDKTHCILNKNDVIKTYITQANEKVPEYNRSKLKFNARKKISLIQQDARVIQRSCSIDLASDSDEEKSSSSDTNQEELTSYRKTGQFNLIEKEQEKENKKINLQIQFVDEDEINIDEQYSIQNEHNSYRLETMGGSFNMVIEESKNQDPLQKSCQLTHQSGSVKQRGLSATSQHDLSIQIPKEAHHKPAKMRKNDKEYTHLQSKKRKSSENIRNLFESPKLTKTFNVGRKKLNSGGQGNEILHELRQIILKQKLSENLNQMEVMKEEVVTQMGEDGYESSFSIDGLQNYQNFHSGWNPSSVISQVRKHQKSIRRLAMYKRKLLEQQRQ